MKISSKGRYALRMLLDLAENGENGVVALKDIAERQNISKKYLEQIVPLLNKAELLITSRGFQGGYKLSKEPNKYTVGEILKATEGSLSPVSCLDCNPIGCDRIDNCATIPVWKGLYKVINEYLYGITLQDILDNQKELGQDEYII